MVGVQREEEPAFTFNICCMRKYKDVTRRNGYLINVKVKLDSFLKKIKKKSMRALVVKQARV